MTIATWRPHPHTSYDCDVLATDEEFAKDRCVAKVEDFGYACYPMALNATTGKVERGGAFEDRVAARLWAERVAGLHPTKPTDDRPAFYYERISRAEPSASVTSPTPRLDIGVVALGAASTVSILWNCVLGGDDSRFVWAALLLVAVNYPSFVAACWRCAARRDSA